DVIGDVIDLELDQKAISIMTIQKEQVFTRNEIARGHHLFAQANSLAVAVINDELALTSKADIQFTRQVKLNEQVIAKAEVEHTPKKRKAIVHVHSYVKNELVFYGVFHMYRTSEKEREEMKIAIDAMGGDNAPKAIVEGAMEAVSKVKNLEITLEDNEREVKPYYKNEERNHILHTKEVVSGDDEPMRVVRTKKTSSLVLTAKEVKEKRADACISAGNTGALVVSGLFVVGRMKGIDRPALSPILPTTDQRGFLLLDAGANVDA